MDADIKIKWLEALRGGQYKQGVGDLRYNGTYCCLGVLCTVVDPDWEIGNGWFGMPEGVFKASGLKSADPATLAKMNDHEGKSFDEIANYIEENL